MWWVVNASPVILLAKIGHADLLLRLPHRTVIPESAAAEIRAAPPNDPGRLWLEALPPGIIQPDKTLPVEVAGWDLGAGESAVIAWALEDRQWEAVLDDRAARRCAEVMKVPVTGSIGVILAAKKRGIIPHAAVLISALQGAGAYLSEALVKTALQLVGE
jgi:predicted nucleic acid-binding protein